MTVLAYGTMVHVCAAAIEDSGHDAELIDLRSIVPLDIDTIVESVNKTGRCIIVHEASRFGGFGGELSALIQERCFYALEGARAARDGLMIRRTRTPSSGTIFRARSALHAALDFVMKAD